MSKYSHTKARIEKKFSKNAKELLISLFPSLSGNEFSLESESFESYRHRPVGSRSLPLTR